MLQDNLKRCNIPISRKLAFSVYKGKSFPLKKIQKSTLLFHIKGGIFMIYPNNHNTSVRKITSEALIL